MTNRGPLILLACLAAAGGLGCVSGGSAPPASGVPPTPITLVTPTCRVDETVLAGGANGYCTELGNQRFAIRVEDFVGTQLLELSWPDDLQAWIADPLPAVDCKILCEAGLMELLHSSGKLQPGATLPNAPPPPANPGTTNSCYVAKNARQEYNECGTAERFYCFRACGAGCIGCNVRVFDTACGPAGTSCSGRMFRCYQRPCCVEHDQRLAAASQYPNSRQRFAHSMLAHIGAKLQDCGLDDAVGDTWDEREATCLDFGDLCLVD